MVLRRFLILFSIFCAGLQWTGAQTPRVDKPLSNLRKHQISTLKDSIVFDSLSIIPRTFRINGVPDSTYRVDELNAVLIWKQKPGTDSVWIFYRVFPQKLNAVAQRMNYDSVMSNFIGQPYTPNYGTDPRTESFFNFGNINYNGSFGRGISFGNSQDAVVTSNLNLQLNGYLADSIEIAAAITDNNIPIQPDGTTQQLNEFDRIFLSFKKNSWMLSLGDIDLRQNQLYFLNFYKRLQGAAFETTSKIGRNSTNKTVVSGSIAKGKFTRNIFQGQEGNQGPYRLIGANNEFFFVVLANTERVWIDGVLMQRGEDQDYIINYNTAEIAFMPRRMITKDSRIQVEFEYADRNYLNSNIYLFNETDINQKFKVRLGLFNNSDAKNSPINQTLDPAQKRFLDSIGGATNLAFYPNAVIDTFSANKILYKKIDTVFNGGATHDSIYVYSTNPDSAFYSLSFIEVGVGIGDYIPDFNGANGKVYKWVAPVNGVKQGRFAPVIFLVTPKKQQVISLGMDYAIAKRTTISTELATSYYDVNLFSNKDNKNNRAFAGKALLNNTIPLSSKGLKLVNDLSYEYVESNFKPLERLRNVEFTRDWGLPLVVLPQDETILNASTALADAKNNQLKYQFTQYLRGDDFTGIRNTVIHYQDIKGWKFNNVFMISNVDTKTQEGYFLKPRLELSKKFTKLKNHTIGASYSLERNAFRSKLTDSLTAGSFSFQTFEVRLRSDETKLNSYQITYFTRTDAYPVGKDLVNADRSQNITVATDLLKSERHKFRFNTTYRKLDILKPGLTNQKADNSLLGRVQYSVDEWKGLLTGDVLYELGAGQEQKRDLAYLEVPAGQGEYTWIDYNNDGIQQLNEFELALFSDQAKFIRIFTPTNEFIKANYTSFNYSFSLNPRAVINLTEAPKLSKFIARINLQSSLQISKKENADGSIEFNPFKGNIQDTSLITLAQIFINTFSFNRFSSKWGFDVNNSRNSGKALLTYGYESRELNDWNFKSRLNLSKVVAITLVGKTGTNKLTSSNPKFDNKNYDIKQNAIEPGINITRGSNFRLVLGYRITDKKNSQGAKEQSLSNSINTEVKYNILQNTSILAKFTYSDITFNSKDPVANTNSPAAYIMLDGLLPGKNFLWTLDLTKRLSNSLELNIQYEGRKPGTARTVHIGRASIRAIL